MKLLKRCMVLVLPGAGLFLMGGADFSPGETVGKAVVVDGYMNRFGYFPGDTALVFINMSEKTRTNIHLLAFNNKVVDTVEVELNKQNINSSKPSVNGFGYRESFRYQIPNLKSGLYTWENTRIFFIVKEPQKRSDVVVLYPYNTLQAYCATGGKSFYNKLSTERKASAKISFLRPVLSPAETEFTEGFNRWIVNTRYNYRYISDIDMDDYTELAHSKILVVIGHSEYWTRKARNNFDRFVKSGKNVMILSGNTMWWQVRYNEKKTQMICYKTERDSVNDPLLVTTTWDQASLRYPITKSIGCNFVGYGLKSDKGWNGFKIVADASPLIAGTKLGRGDVLPCFSQEIDGAPIKGLDADSIPLIDSHTLGFKKVELIGFDWGSRSGKNVVHTFFAFQKNRRSGKIINVGTTNWCTRASFTNASIIKITENMFDLLLANKSIFSTKRKTGNP